ncbi:MAG: ferritin family protein [Candidatus Thermoplasmatota archaeon]
MDLGHFQLNELLLAALKSELESKTMYTQLAQKIKNGLLSDKLLFLAAEEEKHRQYIEELYKTHYPDEPLTIPKTTPVPLPELTTISETTKLSTLLAQAMHAEQAAETFYQELATRFPNDTKIKNTLLYFSKMELGHYKILELEKQSMEQFEGADEYWPMIHAGP